MSIAVAERTVTERSVTERLQELVRAFVQRMQFLGYAENTVKSYRLVLERLVALYPNVPFERMTARQIEAYILSRTTLSRRSKKLVFCCLRTFFRYLIRTEELMVANPCDRVDMPRFHTRMKQAPTLAQFEALRARCKKLDLATFAEVCFFAGLRLREALNLRVGDVDLATRQIRVWHGKGDKDRITMYPPRVGALLEQLIGDRPRDAFVFPTIKPSASDSPPRRPSTVRRMQWGITEAAKAAGVPFHVTAHSLRHGFTKMCKLNGVPLEFTAKLLGHSSVATTAALYGALDVSDVQHVYDKLVTGVAS